MSELTSIFLPQSVPFPVTISSIPCHPGQPIARHSTLFKYKYWDYQDDPNSREDPPPKIRVERIGTYESPIEGEVTNIFVHVNQEIPHAGFELCSIREPCAHAVQYGGLCAVCGKSVEDDKDYSGYNYEDRATIAMSHDNTGLKISLDEATKIEQTNTSRLTQEKKLILVVDLDQTVIHATVDPTVGEWQADPSNPNYPAIKDVQSFCLEEDPILPPDWTGPRPPPTKCWYYVKLRPGLAEFLALVASKYELHIYTMATRNYALAIAKIIDPDGHYFGDRILSRDESGSLTHKNLKRLFPVDQSMVVIIDDRGDVWQWEKNLIKVVPYDFFVGIGDINSSFLPKKNGQITGPTKKRKTIAQLEALDENQASDPSKQDKSDSPERTNNGNNDSTSNEKDNGDTTKQGGGAEDEEIISTQDSETTHDSSSSPVDRILELGGGEDNANLLMEQSLTRNQSLEQQQHDRPLAKLQHNLDKIIHDHEAESRHSSPDSNSSSDDNDNDDDEEDDNLLYDDDTELYSLEKSLVRIHEEYYIKYQQYQQRRLTQKPDLGTIIPQLKSKCLEGITVLFSGILPLGINIETADIVIWCRQFGVDVVNEVYTDSVTHVVCRDPNTGGHHPFRQGLTLKVRVARKLIPDVKIVNPDWLFACLSAWSKVDESPFLVGGSEEEWHVEDNDVRKYQRAIESAKAKNEARMFNRPRFDSVGSLEEYDLDNANQEVDDFLAGISDDDEDNEEAIADDDEEDEDEENETGQASGTDSFIRDAFKANVFNRNKRKLEEDSDSDDEPSREANGGDRTSESAHTTATEISASSSLTGGASNGTRTTKRLRLGNQRASNLGENNGSTHTSNEEKNEFEPKGSEEKKEPEAGDEEDEKEVDLDELEQELLDGFDDLDEA